MTELELKLQSAARLASKGKVSRRDFVQLALAAGRQPTEGDGPHDRFRAAGHLHLFINVRQVALHRPVTNA